MRWFGLKPHSGKVNLAAQAVVLVLVAMQVPVTEAAPAATYSHLQTSGQLMEFWLGDDLGCQVRVKGNPTGFEFSPAQASPADCGTFVAVNGVLYGPDFADHASTKTSFGAGYQPFTPVSQTLAQTPNGAFTLVSVVRAGTTGLEVRQVDVYDGSGPSYRTSVEVYDTRAIIRPDIPTVELPVQQVVVYRAGDCRLRGSDSGYGYFPIPSVVGCTSSKDANPTEPRIHWVAKESSAPATQRAMEGLAADVWAAIAAQTPLPHTAVFNVDHDNGAGLSWSLAVRPSFASPAPVGATASHLTVFV